VPATLVRNYPMAPIDPRLNFPPTNSYQDRLVPLIDREPSGGWIDVDMYRITMALPIDASIRAASRGVRIRMYLEPTEYTNTARPSGTVKVRSVTNPSGVNRTGHLSINVVTYTVKQLH
jgi:hypothetical protein